MIIDKITIQNKAGLHARPASMFVQCANNFKSEIYIKKETTRVNAKSIMGVMILAVKKGDEIEIEATGDDERKAIEALKDLINRKFDYVDEIWKKLIRFFIDIYFARLYVWYGYGLYLCRFKKQRLEKKCENY